MSFCKSSYYCALDMLHVFFEITYAQWIFCYSDAHLGACNLLGVKQILHRILSGEFVFPPVDYKPLKPPQNRVRGS